MMSLSMPTAEPSTPAPTKGEVGELKQALHGTVFAEWAVKHRKNNVHGADAGPGRGAHYRCVARPRQHGPDI